ncbi:MAG TPA: hypothetical protein VJ617_05685 [Arthrobacter sp.]|nr:hypothetical protein [Arthrobacter sp.]
MKAGGSAPSRPREGLSPGVVEVRVGNPNDVLRALDDAVRAVGEAADRYGTGIMITDVGGGGYVVRAHPAVPHGLVRERRS